MWYIASYEDGVKKVQKKLQKNLVGRKKRTNFALANGKEQRLSRKPSREQNPKLVR